MSANQLPRSDPGEETSRREPTSAVTPRDFILEHLRAAGGQLTERQLVMEVGYGTPACRRVLAELETAGRVERRDVGPETVVYVTDAEPATSGAVGPHAAD